MGVLAQSTVSGHMVALLLSLTALASLAGAQLPTPPPGTPDPTINASWYRTWAPFGTAVGDSEVQPADYVAGANFSIPSGKIMDGNFTMGTVRLHTTGSLVFDTNRFLADPKVGGGVPPYRGERTGPFPWSPSTPGYRGPVIAWGKGYRNIVGQRGAVPAVNLTFDDFPEAGSASAPTQSSVFYRVVKGAVNVWPLYRSVHKKAVYRGMPAHFRPDTCIVTTAYESTTEPDTTWTRLSSQMLLFYGTFGTTNPTRTGTLLVVRVKSVGYYYKTRIGVDTDPDPFVASRLCQLNIYGTMDVNTTACDSFYVDAFHPHALDGDNITGHPASEGFARGELMWVLNSPDYTPTPSATMSPPNTSSVSPSVSKSTPPTATPRLTPSTSLQPTASAAVTGTPNVTSSVGETQTGQAPTKTTTAAVTITSAVTVSQDRTKTVELATPAPTPLPSPAPSPAPTPAPSPLPASSSSSAQPPPVQQESSVDGPSSSILRSPHSSSPSSNSSSRSSARSIAGSSNPTASGAASTPAPVSEPPAGRGGDRIIDGVNAQDTEDVPIGWVVTFFVVCGCVAALLANRSIIEVAIGATIAAVSFAVNDAKDPVSLGLIIHNATAASGGGIVDVYEPSFPIAILPWWSIGDDGLRFYRGMAAGNIIVMLAVLVAWCLAFLVYFCILETSTQHAPGIVDDDEAAVKLRRRLIRYRAAWATQFPASTLFAPLAFLSYGTIAAAVTLMKEGTRSADAALGVIALLLIIALGALLTAVNVFATRYMSLYFKDDGGDRLIQDAVPIPMSPTAADIGDDGASDSAGDGSNADDCGSPLECGSSVATVVSVEETAASIVTEAALMKESTFFATILRPTLEWCPGSFEAWGQQTEQLNTSATHDGSIDEKERELSPEIRNLPPPCSASPGHATRNTTDNTPYGSDGALPPHVRLAAFLEEEQDPCEVLCMVMDKVLPRPAALDVTAPTSTLLPPRSGTAPSDNAPTGSSASPNGEAVADDQSDQTKKTSDIPAAVNGADEMAMEDVGDDNRASFFCGVSPSNYANFAARFGNVNQTPTSDFDSNTGGTPNAECGIEQHVFRAKRGAGHASFFILRDRTTRVVRILAATVKETMAAVVAAEASVPMEARRAVARRRTSLGLAAAAFAPRNTKAQAQASELTTRIVTRQCSFPALAKLRHDERLSFSVRDDAVSANGRSRGVTCAGVVRTPSTDAHCGGAASPMLFDVSVVDHCDGQSVPEAIRAVLKLNGIVLNAAGRVVAAHTCPVSRAAGPGKIGADLGACPPGNLALDDDEASGNEQPFGTNSPRHGGGLHLCPCGDDDCLRERTLRDDSHPPTIGGPDGDGHNGGDSDEEEWTVMERAAAFYAWWLPVVAPLYPKWRWVTVLAVALLIACGIVRGVVPMSLAFTSPELRKGTSEVVGHATGADVTRSAVVLATHAVASGILALVVVATRPFLCSLRTIVAAVVLSLLTFAAIVAFAVLMQADGAIPATETARRTIDLAAPVGVCVLAAVIFAVAQLALLGVVLRDTCCKMLFSNENNTKY